MSKMKADGIAVTGASGFIASWLVKCLLERGAVVHATVRARSNREKVAHLEQLGEAFPGRLHLFEADLLKPNSFNQAFDGCSAIVHTASPFTIQCVRDAERELIAPAVEGTRNVLRGASEATSVRRVVLTSSIVATYGDSSDVRRYAGGVASERDWNTTSTPHHQPYAYSKVAAERIAWEIAGGQTRWQLVTILPGFVVGPSMSSRIDGTSTDLVLQMLDGRLRSGVPDLRFGMVDVRDVAKAHAEAVLRDEASGRYIVSAESRSLPDLAALLRRRYPARALIPRGPLAAAMLYIAGPFMGMSWRYLRRNLGIDVRFDNTRSQQDLDLQYASIEGALYEQAEQLLRHLETGER